MLGERLADIARRMLGECSVGFAHRACSAMLGGISGVDSWSLSWKGNSTFLVVFIDIYRMQLQEDSFTSPLDVTIASFYHQ